MLALKVNGPVERGRFDEPEIGGRDSAVAPVSHYFAGPRNGSGLFRGWWRTFLGGFHFRIFLLSTVCATFCRAVCVFFSLI